MMETRAQLRQRLLQPVVRLTKFDVVSEEEPRRAKRPRLDQETTFDPVLDLQPRESSRAVVKRKGNKSVVQNATIVVSLNKWSELKRAVVEKDEIISKLTDELYSLRDEFIDRLAVKDEEISELTIKCNEFIAIMNDKDEEIEMLTELNENVNIEIKNYEERTTALQQSTELLSNLQACNRILLEGASKCATSNPEGKVGQNVTDDDSSNSDFTEQESDSEDFDRTDQTDIGHGVWVHNRVIQELDRIKQNKKVNKYDQARKKLKLLYTHVFSDEEFATSSRTGKPGNTGTCAKKKLNKKKVEVVQRYVFEQSDEDVKKHIEGYVKAVLKAKCSNAAAKKR